MPFHIDNATRDHLHIVGEQSNWIRKCGNTWQYASWNSRHGTPLTALCCIPGPTCAWDKISTFPEDSKAIRGSKQSLKRTCSWPAQPAAQDRRGSCARRRGGWSNCRRWSAACIRRPASRCPVRPQPGSLVVSLGRSEIRTWTRSSKAERGRSK